MVEKVKEKKRRKILVTGSGGMLGVDLCKELSNDYEIVRLDIRNVEQRDITDRKKTVEVIVNAKPDLVIHTAAWTDVDGCEKDPAKTKLINEEGTRHVAISTAELNIPLIYISTDFVFDGGKQIPYTEEDLPNPQNLYGRSKLEGEKIVRALAKYIILRTGWLYGQHGKNFVDTILDMAKNEKELHVVDDQIGCPTYTKDFAKAIHALLRARTGTVREIYHISNKGRVNWFEYAKEILRLADLIDIKLVPIKSAELDRPAKRPAYSVLDNNKFNKATNFFMRPWQEALAEYLSRKIKKQKLKIKNGLKT